MKVITGAEEYYLKGNNEGVIVVHGYTGTPAEMRPLADYVHEQGYTVLGVRLKGHGTDYKELETTTWEEWYSSLTEGIERLSKDCDKIYVVGLSMGALLTLKAATEFPVEKIVVMAPPIFVCDWRASYAWFFKYFIKTLKKHKKIYPAGEKYDLSYDVLPAKPLPSLFKLAKLCREKYISKINIPTLIVQSQVEHTVKPKSAQFVYDHLKPKLRKLIWVYNSSHIVTLDNDRKMIFEDVVKFLKENIHEKS